MVNFYKIIRYSIIAISFSLLAACSSLPAYYTDSCNSLDKSSYSKIGNVERFTVENGDTKCDADDKYGSTRIMERAEKQSSTLFTNYDWEFIAKIKFIQLGDTRNIFNQIHAGGYQVTPPFWIAAKSSLLHQNKVDIVDMMGYSGSGLGVFEYGIEHKLRIVYDFEPNNILNISISVDDEEVYFLKGHNYQGSQVYSKYGIYRFHYNHQNVNLKDSIIEFNDAKMQPIKR
jgi:hypothetical protein